MTIAVQGTDLEFASLAATLKWAHKARPSSVHLLASGVHRCAGITWDYDPPDGFSLTGGVFDGAMDARSPTWGLAYAPQMPETTRDQPHQRSVSFRNVTFRNYSRGGLNIGHWSGGETTWITGLEIDRCTFEALGGSEPHGLAGVYLQGVLDASVVSSSFLRLENPGRKASALHAVYAVDASTVTVTKSVFSHVSGDPVRVRDGSRATVSHSVVQRSGVHALLSTWSAFGERPSSGTVVNCRLGRTYDNSRRLKEFYRVS